MKILAYVEVGENGIVLQQLPIKTFSARPLNEIENFWNTARKLIEIEKNKVFIEKRESSNTLAEIKRLDAMGFMHVSKIDAYFETKLNEVIERTKQNIWMEKQKAKLKIFTAKALGVLMLKFIRK
jgi:hypothetical protein